MRGVAKRNSFVMQLAPDAQDDEGQREAAIQKAKDIYLPQFEPAILDVMVKECRFVAPIRADGRNWPASYVISFEPIFSQ